jgi:hypothetical protein
MTQHNMSTNPSDYIQVPIEQSLYRLLLDHLDSQENPVAIINEVISDFVHDRFNRRETLGQLQRQYQTNEALVVQEQAWMAYYGDRSEGLFWDRLFLRNSTKLRTRYKGREYIAEVRHGQIWFRNESTTPSKFANAAANNTIRNAWRDLDVQFLGEDWKSAQTLRHNPPARSFLDLDIWSASVSEYNGIGGASIGEEAGENE